MRVELAEGERLMCRCGQSDFFPYCDQTCKKINAEKMGYALSLTELARVEPMIAERAKTVEAAPGPVAADAMPAPVRIPALLSQWDTQFANARQGPGVVALDRLGGVYWVTPPQTLPKNFVLTIPCQVDFLRGQQVLFATQGDMLRSIYIRWAAPDLSRSIAEADGYTFRFSHSHLVLMRNGYQNVARLAQVGNPDEPFVIVITRRDGVITFSVDDEQLLTWKDEAPLAPGGRFSIGGYLSALILGDVTIADLDEP